MSSPLNYLFYRVTKNEQTASSADVSIEGHDGVEVVPIPGLLSDYCADYYPSTDHDIKKEAIIALAKFSRYVDAGKRTPMEAAAVNSVGIGNSILSFNDLAKFIKDAESDPDIALQGNVRDRFLETISRNFPFFAQFKHQ